jgi:hypothetical protein
MMVVPCKRGDVMNDNDPKSDPAALPLPVATFRSDSLTQLDDQRPSVRWQQRQRRVLVPIMAVSVASAAAAALLTALRGDGAIGVAFVMTMPVVIGVLAGMFDVGTDDRPPPHDTDHQELVYQSRLHTARHRLVRSRVWKGTAIGTLAAIAASVIGVQEGAICVAMLSPFYFLGAVGVAHLLVKPARSRLRRWLKSKDRLWLADHPGSKLLGILLLVVGVPAASGPFDRCFIDDQLRATSSSSVVLPVAIDQAWSSLHTLDIHAFQPSPLWWSPLLPEPVRLLGEARQPGDVRRVVFDNGEIEATVTSSFPPTDYDIALRVVWSGREFFDHWVSLENGTFHFDAIDSHHTRLVHHVHYQPKLFPRVLFEPLERAWGDAMQQQLLDSFAVTLAAQQPVVVAQVP